MKGDRVRAPPNLFQHRQILSLSRLFESQFGAQLIRNLLYHDAGVPIALKVECSDGTLQRHVWHKSVTIGGLLGEGLYTKSFSQWSNRSLEPWLFCQEKTVGK